MKIKLGKWTGPVFFMAGVVTAKNWPKIRKRFKKYIVPVENAVAGVYAGLMGFVTEQKEKLEQKQKPKKKVEFNGVADPEGAILFALKENKTGKTLAELAQFIGVPMITLAVPSKKLTEAGKIRKEGKRYFLVEKKGGEI